MTAVARARAAWGDGLPDWVIVLAQACDAQSQSAIAKRLGYSPAAISYVLSNRYAARLETVEKTVRGALLAEKVDCPVLAALPVNECLGHQRAALSTSSPLAVRLWRACQTCQHRRETSNGKP